MRWHDCHQHDLHWMRPQAVLPLPHVLIALQKHSTNTLHVMKTKTIQLLYVLEQSSCAIPLINYFISTNAFFGLSLLRFYFFFTTFFASSPWVIGNSWATEWLFAGTLYYYHGRQIDVFLSPSPPPCTRLVGEKFTPPTSFFFISPPLESKN
ncbi:hypothetical protein M431DRAFT_409316 [Trichoderma harzianum CBS 226.95]|uniref:Uncharacterized protein n=1 Tax=Trichoderma harzianum CBS 226.95 TaxID=983964 RepID=A0A2T4AFD2_TRIHA|nr:hypothetical protein M431DRAFT_409316 [Trichoderma harzianum CBS 226.95]PTB55805.1 hypothetical protein M431DRAFT_409316 [Trichoderma harzianum CBS 226.95]